MLLIPLLLLACSPDSEPLDSGPLDSGLDDTGAPGEVGPWVDYFGDAPDQETRLALFDDLWNAYAKRFPGLVWADVDWDQRYDELRPQVADADSYGEFYRLLSHMLYDVGEGHSHLRSEQVCGTDLEDRPPVFRSEPWTYDGRQDLGACVTATAEGTGLVFSAEDGNPGGLQPGDEILGYDGQSWAELLPAALDHPFCGRHAGSLAADGYLLADAVGKNFHLYETMEVRRGSSGKVESIPTEQLLGYDQADPICAPRMDLPVPLPWATWDDAYSDATPVAWGLVPDTNIGLIIVQGWTGSAGTDFLAAVEELYETDGLIVDFRCNTGGNMFLSFDALAVLFGEDIEGVFGIGFRESREDYEALELTYDGYGVTVDPDTSYEQPIAILTGPQAISSGDIVAWYLANHPTARRFGRPTNGSPCYDSASGSVWDPDDLIGDLDASRTTCTGVDQDGVPLALGGVVPEEELWLTPEDVLAGRDTVYEAALAWVTE